MSRSLFQLKKTIGRNYSVDPDDVLRTKKMLKELGYFEIPEYGVTPYPDEPMFRGIQQFQDDFDLEPDGMINPDGETTEKVNEVLNYKTGSPIPKAQVTQSQLVTRTRPAQNKDDLHEKERGDQGNEQIAVAPAIPIIVYEIAALFSMTVAAAYAWWISLSSEEKNKIRAQINKAQENGATEDTDDNDCERLFKIDMETCRQIAKRRGKRAGARCYASANERYSSCLRGRPLPPLDTWNN